MKFFDYTADKEVALMEKVMAILAEKGDTVEGVTLDDFFAKNEKYYNSIKKKSCDIY